MGKEEMTGPGTNVRVNMQPCLCVCVHHDCVYAHMSVKTP